MKKKPRIGIDLQSLQGQKTGFGFYLESLLKELKQYENQYEFVFIDKVRDTLNTPKRILWDQVGLPLTAYRMNLDILFTPSFSSPFLYRKKTVSVCHDIIGKLFGQNFSLSAKIYWKFILPYSMKSANHIITISEHSKNDLHEHLNISPENITVTPLGSRTIFRKISDDALLTPTLKQYGLKKNLFALTVGTIEPRKNLPRLVEAWANTTRPAGMKLVIVGKKGWGYHDLKITLQKFELESEVIIVDYISDKELVALYNSCSFMVFPSLYEGFGLPALEAMACGTACVCSKASSIPEVTGDAAIYFDPEETHSIKEALQTAFDDTDTISHLRSKSIAQAQKFSWKKCAEYTVAVFDHILK